MEIIRQTAAALLGLAGGMVAAAGVFALITFLGLLPRLVGRTHTGEFLHGYEMMVVAGGALGTLLSQYWEPVSELTGIAKRVSGTPLAGILLFGFTVCAGIYIGGLIMSLAESLNVIPILCRKLRIRKGMAWMVACIAAGKLVGSLMYYWYGW